MKKRVLIVEDDDALVQILSHNLVHEGFQVQCAADADQALSIVKSFVPDLVLLDLTLPGAKSGLDLCAAWRHEHQFPVIMLTARGRKADKLAGLRGGADDYVTKPFDLDELLARIDAVLRRARPSVERLEMGTLIVDFVKSTAQRGRESVQLTHREFSLLRYLAQRPNTIVHRDELLREVWGYPEDPLTRSVDKAINRLRIKVEHDPHHPVFILTAHGDGYSFSLGGDGTRSQ